MKRLKTETDEPAFVKSVLDRLKKNCPMSLKVTLAQMRLARTLTLGEVLKMEYRCVLLNTQKKIDLDPDFLSTLLLCLSGASFYQPSF
jgi:enoyl-CoA hydratase/carnithine racemase